MAFELEQKLLDVLFTLLLGFAVPRVHLLTHLVFLYSLDLFDIKLVFQGCLVLSDPLIEVIVEVLLLDSLL